jgi:hypothetical protein
MSPMIEVIGGVTDSPVLLIMHPLYKMPLRKVSKQNCEQGPLLPILMTSPFKVLSSLQ